MPAAPFNIKGLSDQDVLEARKQFGNNQLTFKKNHGFIRCAKKYF
jgi:hypothetical protein